MATISQILQISKHDHNMLKFGIYMIWCEPYAMNDQDLQKLLANTKLYRYWNSVYIALEGDFLEKVKDYQELDKDVLWDFYDSITHNIVNYYSKPLIKKALKTQHYEFKSN